MLKYAVALYPICLVVLTVQQVLRPQRVGLLAFAEAIAPYLFLPLLPLVAGALLTRATTLRVALIASTIVFVARFPPSLPRTPIAAPAGAALVTVMNWNIRSGSRADQSARLLPVLASHPADIVVLEEADWRWLCCDPVRKEQYPHGGSLYADHEYSGLVVMSTYPWIDSGTTAPPRNRGWNRVMWVRMDLGDGRDLLLIAAHPRSPRIGPFHYRPDDREALIPTIRSLVDTALARGDQILLVGDFNTTEREPAYGDLAHGLQDAQRIAGRGWGATWGINPGHRWLQPLLRIDYMFSGPGVVPLSLTTDCAFRGSDHCIVHGTFAVGSEVP